MADGTNSRYTVEVCIVSMGTNIKLSWYSVKATKHCPYIALNPSLTGAWRWWVLQLQVALWKSVLDPVQSAKLVVQAWPQYPDVLTIMNTVCELGVPPTSAFGNCDSRGRRLPIEQHFDTQAP